MASSLVGLQAGHLVNAKGCLQAQATCSCCSSGRGLPVKFALGFRKTGCRGVQGHQWALQSSSRSTRPLSNGTPNTLSSRKISFPLPGKCSKHRRRHAVAASSRDNESAGTQAASALPFLFDKVTIKQVAAMFAAGAVLGPLLDGRHSHHNVLHYTDPTITHVGPLDLETCWWVPLLFGVAAIILGVGHTLTDTLAPKGADYSSPPGSSLLKNAPKGGLGPSWGFVFAGIALFTCQYDLSGLLDAWAASGGLRIAVDVALVLTAVLHWGLFDCTAGGLFWAVLTAVSGPVVEILLINWLGLYHYTHPDVLGIPSWIPWVYFCGAPAVGNLGRKVLAELRSS